MSMQRNKYLEDIGLKRNEYGTNFISNKDKRNKLWKKQRRKYGFDSRDCWNLNTSFIEWLYSHLKMYLKEAGEIIDLEYYKFEFEGKIYTQREAIEFIIEKLKRRLTYNWTEDKDAAKDNYAKEAEIEADVKRACHLWAEILPCMWW